MQKTGKIGEKANFCFLFWMFHTLSPFGDFPYLRGRIQIEELVRVRGVPALKCRAKHIRLGYPALKCRVMHSPAMNRRVRIPPIRRAGFQPHA